MRQEGRICVLIFRYLDQICKSRTHGLMTVNKGVGFDQDHDLRQKMANLVEDLGLKTNICTGRKCFHTWNDDLTQRKKMCFHRCYTDLTKKKVFP